VGKGGGGKGGGGGVELGGHIQRTGGNGGVGIREGHGVGCAIRGPVV